MIALFTTNLWLSVKILISVEKELLVENKYKSSKAQLVSDQNILSFFIYNTLIIKELAFQR